jgi:DNA replication and repair protein RecF
LEEGVVLLHGPNGAGKTNLLEALHVGTQGFSPRARRDAQMIRFGADAGRVTLTGSRGDGAFETDVILTRRESRRVSLNGDRLVSVERLRHQLTTLVFTPDRLAVVKGAPATRRAYLDRAAGRLFPARANVSADYSSAVGQRNAALRRTRMGQSTREALAPWTTRVAELGAELVGLRTDVVALLEEGFTEAAGELGLESASLAYEGEPASAAELDARLDADLERGLTGAGPHLHDLRIEAGGRDLRVFGSQGEQRVAVLSLVMSEAAALRERHGTSPLVLLDDVLSELDGDRRVALAAMISHGAQTVVTATAAAALPGEPAQSLAVMPGLVR